MSSLSEFLKAGLKDVQSFKLKDRKLEFRKNRELKLDKIVDGFRQISDSPLPPTPAPQKLRNFNEPKVEILSPPTESPPKANNKREKLLLKWKEERKKKKEVEQKKAKPIFKYRHVNPEEIYKFTEPVHAFKAPQGLKMPSITPAIEPVARYTRNRTAKRLQFNLQQKSSSSKENKGGAADRNAGEGVLLKTQSTRRKSASGSKVRAPLVPTRTLNKVTKPAVSHATVATLKKQAIKKPAASVQRKEITLGQKNKGGAPIVSSKSKNPNNELKVVLKKLSSEEEETIVEPPILPSKGQKIVQTTRSIIKKNIPVHSSNEESADEVRKAKISIKTRSRNSKSIKNKEIATNTAHQEKRTVATVPIRSKRLSSYRNEESRENKAQKSSSEEEAGEEIKNIHNKFEVTADVEEATVENKPRRSRKRLSLYKKEEFNENEAQESLEDAAEELKISERKLKATNVVEKEEIVKSKSRRSTKLGTSIKSYESHENNALEQPAQDAEVLDDGKKRGQKRKVSLFLEETDANVTEEINVLCQTPDVDARNKKKKKLKTTYPKTPIRKSTLRFSNLNQDDSINNRNILCKTPELEVEENTNNFDREEKKSYPKTPIRKSKARISKVNEDIITSNVVIEEDLVNRGNNSAIKRTSRRKSKLSTEETDENNIKIITTVDDSDSVLNTTFTKDDDKEELNPKTPKLGDEGFTYVSPFVTMSRGSANARKEYWDRRANNGISILSPQNTGPKAAAAHFTKLLDGQVAIIRKMCLDWETYKTETSLPEEANDIINTAVGQSNLLLTKKMEKFRGLIARCANEFEEPRVTEEDLHGYWDLLWIEIKNVDQRFENLAKLRDNNWQEAVVPKTKTVRAAKKKAPVAGKKRASIKSKIKDAIRAARAKKAVVEKRCSSQGIAMLPQVTPLKNRNSSVGTPRSELRNSTLLKSVLSNEARKSVARSPGLSMMRASSIGKEVESPSNPRGILKTPASVRKSKIVVFNDNKTVCISPSPELFPQYLEQREADNDMMHVDDELEALETNTPSEQTPNVRKSKRRVTKVKLFNVS